MAVVEFARNVLGIKDAASGEFVPDTKEMVIHLIASQKGVEDKGGTMRLGMYPCKIVPETKTAKAYGITSADDAPILERHRHRFEFNNTYRPILKEAGLIISGESPDGSLVEIVELENHPFFIGSQFHPELKSTVENPHPLFVGFIAAALVHNNEKKSKAAFEPGVN